MHRFILMDSKPGDILEGFLALFDSLKAPCERMFSKVEIVARMLLIMPFFDTNPRLISRGFFDLVASIEMPDVDGLLEKVKTHLEEAHKKWIVSLHGTWKHTLYGLGSHLIDKDAGIPALEALGLEILDTDPEDIWIGMDDQGRIEIVNLYASVAQHLPFTGSEVIIDQIAKHMGVELTIEVIDRETDIGSELEGSQPTHAQV